MKAALTLFFSVSILVIGFTQSNSSFDIVAGVDLTYRSLGTAENSEFAQVLIASREDEVAALNWRFGVNYKKTLSEKTYLKLGARLSSLGYDNPKVNYLRWGSQHDGMGGFDPNLDPDPGLPSTVKFNYDYLFIEIPVSFGITKKKDKFSLFAEVGLSPNIYFKSRTHQITDLETRVDSRKDTGIRSIHISALLGVGVAYHLNEKASVFAQPSFRYHITDLAQEAIINEHLYSYGIEFGISFNL